MNKKLIKLFKHPGVFFRDYFNKRYPETNSEQKYTVNEEEGVHHAEHKLWEIESSISLPMIYEIDAVFTWVNARDKKWLSKKNLYLKDAKLGCENSADDARFEDHNELYYSVNAVKKYLPWIRNIYIVTDNQKPNWLNEDDEQIIFVDHTDLISSKFLPTFNSHVIEAHLHKINGLSENFIYFNDDVFVAQYLDKEHFFRKNGVSSFFLSTKNIEEMIIKGVSTATLKASINSRNILIQDTGIDPKLTLVHSYVPLKKSVYEEFWRLHESRILEFLPNKFRGENDLNLATFLIPWLMYIKGQSVITNEICYYFNIRSNHALAQYKKLINMRSNRILAHSFCANDFSTINQKNDRDVGKDLIQMLRKYYQD
jgi:hypothetical protein